MKKTILFQNHLIEFENEDRFRPDSIVVDGQPASMSKFLEHKNYNWKTSASGNILFYETDDGEIYRIPQERFLNTFQDELREAKLKTGLTNKEFAEKLGVPLRTFEDWRGGKHSPSKFVQEAILDKAKSLLK